MTERAASAVHHTFLALVALAVVAQTSPLRIAMYFAPHLVPTASSYATNVYLERGLSAAGESSSISNVLVAESTSSSAASTSTSEAPFFTSGSIGGQSSSGSDSGSGRQGSVTKTALEWVFAIAALLSIASITAWRYARLRRKNQSMRSFLPYPRNSRSDSTDRVLNTQERRRSLPRTTGLPRPRTMSGDSLPIAATLFYPPSLSHGRYPVLLEPASAHLAHSDSLSAIARGRERERRNRRAAQGADIDAHGRRGGGRDLDDMDGDDKDELPAYESAAIGGPPRYVDGDLHFLGGVPLHVLTLPMSMSNSAPDPTSVEREREVERALQRMTSEESTESSSSPSPDRRRLSESASSVNSTPRALHQANAPALREAHSAREPTHMSFSPNFQPC